VGEVPAAPVHKPVSAQPVASLLLVLCPLDTERTVAQVAQVQPSPVDQYQPHLQPQHQQVFSALPHQTRFDSTSQTVTAAAAVAVVPVVVAAMLSANAPVPVAVAVPVVLSSSFRPAPFRVDLQPQPVQSLPTVAMVETAEPLSATLAAAAVVVAVVADTSSFSAKPSLAQPLQTPSR